MNLKFFAWALLILSFAGLDAAQSGAESFAAGAPVPPDIDVTLHLDDSEMQHFSYLKNLQEFKEEIEREVQFEGPISIVDDPAELRTYLFFLIEAMRNPDPTFLQLFDPKKRLKILELADFLGIDQAGLDKLKPILNIDAYKDLEPEFLEKLNSRISLENPFFIEDQVIKSLPNVYHIYWQPSGEQCWVISDAPGDTGTVAQLYTKDGEPVGQPLADVFSIDWQPNSESYWVAFTNGTAQLYTKDGIAVGDSLTNVRRIFWQPNGSRYWVLFRDGIADLYTESGVVLYANLGRGVTNIIWQPNGESYWVQFRNDTARLYSKNGKALSNLSSVSNIYWQPNGENYFVTFDDLTAQLYTKEGVPLGDRLANVEHISWYPNGEHYFVRFGDSSAQIYTKKGALSNRSNHIDMISRIYWQPNGERFWVKIIDNLAQLYSKNGVSLDSMWTNVWNIIWQPNGERFWMTGRLTGLHQLKRLVQPPLPIGKQILLYKALKEAALEYIFLNSNQKERLALDLFKNNYITNIAGLGALYPILKRNNLVAEMEIPKTFLSSSIILSPTLTAALKKIRAVDDGSESNEAIDES